MTHYKVDVHLYEVYNMCLICLLIQKYIKRINFSTFLFMEGFEGSMLDSFLI